MDLQVGTVIDRYTVEGPLGQGGMATVYSARHNQLGSRHAIKLLKFTVASITERLLQEGRVQSTLRHPNIVAVSDVVSVNGQPGLVMELVDGPSLEQLLTTAPLDLAQCDHLAEGILAGVAYAHAHGLIHRDLKPANILCAVGPRSLTPKVTDFGLAKVLGDDGAQKRTRTGATMGTPLYMAPEQIRDASDCDDRADVWSLGAILYELLTRRAPFDGPDTLSIFNNIAEGRYTPLRQLRPDVPERMLRAVDGALVVDRDERTHSVDLLLKVWKGLDLDAPAEAGAWDTSMLQRVRAIHSTPPASDRPSAETLAEPPRRSVPSSETFALGTLPDVVAPTMDSPPRKKRGRGALLLALALVGAGGVGFLALAAGVAWYTLREPGEDEVWDDVAAAIEQPWFDFVVEPNAEASERIEIREPDAWDDELIDDVVDEIVAGGALWDTWQRLDEVYPRWAEVLQLARQAGLPDVVAAIPFQESRYTPEAQSISCSKGAWQLMPETAVRLGLKVEDCKIGDQLWTPTADAPGPLDLAPYMDGGECQIPQRRGCEVDERTDLGRSSRAAITALGDAWHDREVADSGAAVQLTLASHLVGFDDARFGVPNSSNIRPALHRWLKSHDDEVLPTFYTVDERCGDEPPLTGCVELINEDGRDYVAAILASHYLAVCYYGLNYPDEPAFRAWSRYVEGYCDAVDVPTRAEVVRGE